MRLSSQILLSLMLGTASFTLLPTMAFAQSCTCPSPGIRADVAPPALPEYDQPPMPAPNYIWTPGYWAWNNIDYYWVPGTWVQPPRGGLLWTPGYWHNDSNVYVFTPGYWGQHVGFYGGVAYGHGYTGAGYQGGYWKDNAFFYNRTVNNFGTVNVTNVYEKTVIVDKTTVINRVSYNGGPGGIEIRPTPQEEAAAHEEHVAPTQVQTEHLRAASTNGTLFTAANHGKPAVAATSRAGAFSGEGVIGARAAGAAPEQGTQAPTPAVEPGKALPAGAGQKPNAPNTGEAPAAEPAKPEPAKPEEAKPEGAKPEPAKPEPAKPNEGAPKPVEPEAGKPGTHTLPGVAPAVTEPTANPRKPGEKAHAAPDVPGEPQAQPQHKQPAAKAGEPEPQGQKPAAHEPATQKHPEPEQAAPRPPGAEKGGEHKAPGDKPKRKQPDEN